MTTTTTITSPDGHRTPEPGRPTRTRRLAVAMLLALGTLIVAAGPASARIDVNRQHEYGGDLQCGRNFVRAGLPVVASDARDAVAISILYRASNGQWVPYRYTNWRYTYFGGVTTTRVVGNQDYWYDYYDRSSTVFQSYFGNVPRGTYAVVDFIQNSNGQYVFSPAMTSGGSTICSV